jgi:sortase A
VTEDTAEATSRTWEPLEVKSAGRIARVFSGAGWALVWLGLLTLGFVAHQLWVTTWFAEQGQGALSEERIGYFAAAEVDTVVVTEEAAVLPDGTVIAGGEETGNLGTFDTGEAPVLQVEAIPELHQSFALIRIPKIERLQDGWNVVQGVTRRDLKTGAGHMSHTPLPGQPGNSVISGHRTTYGAPFHELDVLVPGDTIEVETALGTHVYQVRETFIVKPKDVWVVDALPGSWLTLTTCHPKFSARRRLIVKAELVGGPNFDVIQQIGSRL